jgi:anaerobic dimethyl sulfoxide reductase subunit C (anchor subunit)
MAVGAFITLGVLHIVLRRRSEADEIDRVLDPALYAIGPVLVLGLLVSILHVNDVLNILNVFRNWQSSWLSREIIFGLAFAAAGFTFALLQWFKKGTPALRQGIAALTAVLGILLLWSEAMIYYSLEVVPAWHTWVVPFMFVAAAILLGALAVGSAMMVTTVVRGRASAKAAEIGPADTDDDLKEAGGLMAQIRGRIREINSPTSEAEWQLTTRILNWIALVGAVVAIAIIIVSTIYIGDLSQGGAAALESAAVLSGATMWWRLMLTGATAILLGFSVYRLATTTRLSAPRALVAMVLVTMVLALSGEFLGRSLHYEAMMRVGL